MGRNGRCRRTYLRSLIAADPRWATASLGLSTVLHHTLMADGAALAAAIAEGPLPVGKGALILAGVVANQFLPELAPFHSDGVRRVEVKMRHWT